MVSGVFDFYSFGGNQRLSACWSAMFLLLFTEFDFSAKALGLSQACQAGPTQLNIEYGPEIRADL